MVSAGQDQPSELARLEQYTIVANRRQQWDVLLWQMPTMALTGEAFLFTISLGGSTSQTGRIVSSVLALLVALSSLHSLASHRLSELTDSRWLRDHELERGASEVHGITWRGRRERIVQEERNSPSLTDRLVAQAYRLRSIVVWFWTMTLISMASATVLSIAIADPRLLKT